MFDDGARVVILEGVWNPLHTKTRATRAISVKKFIVCGEIGRLGLGEILGDLVSFVYRLLSSYSCHTLPRLAPPRFWVILSQ